MKEHNYWDGSNVEETIRKEERSIDRYWKMEEAVFIKSLKESKHEKNRIGYPHDRKVQIAIQCDPEFL